ncbi:YveK family protein [Kineococcus rhizosphaerae]|uniref:Capsular polysaccharide biosynthesis protein n=1 Tax=Kineococcus rhizosphaerae TaxID=559628 RepID=A0A2T0R161_9ACTN|nr:hypothetical protein [Kineococcus rhizosphaerae]PRY12981.1 capsular polysaccharide biosynthesis protein [Kineococcus rhizosphaerae]
MSIGEFLIALRRRRALVVVLLLLPLVAAVVFSLVRGKTYEATAQAFVSTPSSVAAPDQVVQGSQFAQTRAESYALLARTETVTGPAITSLGLKLTPQQLAREISTSVTLDTVIIDITVEDTSAQRAADIANAVGKQLVSAVGTLEAQSGATSPVAVTIVQPATAPTSPAGPGWLLVLGLGLVAGLALAVCGALVAESLAASRARAVPAGTSLRGEGAPRETRAGSGS